MSRLAFVTLFVFFSHLSSAQLVNGGSINGNISTAGQIDSYFFDGVAGESIRIRVGDTSATAFFPRVELFDASNNSISFNNGTDAAWISTTFANTETYKIEVRDETSTNTGGYVLHFAQMPGANEFGTLYKDIVFYESVSLADIDSYTFSASNGANIQVTVIDLNTTALFPRVDLFDPDGNWIEQGDGSTTATFSRILTTEGIYTLVVYDGTSGGWRTGDYSIELTGTGIVEPNSLTVPIPVGALIGISLSLTVIASLVAKSARQNFS